MADKLSTDEQYGLLIRLGHRAGLVSEEHMAEQIAAEERAASKGSDGPDATDAARAKAAELGVDLSQISGTGADGRITVADVEEAS